MTHEVFNQVPPLVGHDLAADPALRTHLYAKERPGTSTTCTAWAGWPVVRTRSAGPTKPTATHQCFARTTATGTASTRSTSIRRGTRS